MATCRHCGDELEPGATFCRSCATPVPSDAPATEVPPAPTPTRDAAATSPTVAPPPPGPPPPPAARRVWWIGGLGALVVVLIVVLVVLVTSGGGSPRTSVTTTSTTSPTPPPSATPTLSGTPSSADIAHVIARTRDPSTGASFQIGDMGTIPDGSGGMLTAVTGVDQSVNHPPCLVFFWHNTMFLGSDAARPHLGCVLVNRGNEQFVVNYEAFAPRDPLCCPSGTDDVTYTSNGRSFTPNGAPPPSP